MPASIPTFELLDHGGEFLLNDFNGLLHDGVRFEVADGFDLEVEFRRGGVFGEEGGGGVRGVFPRSVFGLGPDRAGS